MPTSTPVRRDQIALFDDCGDMGRLCQDFAWELSPIGAPSSWPAPLRTMVRTVLESPFPMCVLCGPALVHVYNDAYRALLGAKHPRALGQPIAETWAEIWSEVGPLVERAQAGERSALHEGARFLMDRGSGGPREAFFTFSLSPVRDDDLAVIGVLSVAYETTERMLADRDTVAALSEAQQANRSKSDFLAAMSHELRTPLNAIGGYAQLLELGVRGPITPEQKADLRRIQRSKAHLDGLVSGVLDFAKIGAGHIELRTVSIDVDTLLSSVVEMIHPQLEEKGLTLLPIAGPTGATLVGDVDKTRQILLNLAANALKFTTAGGTIRFETRHADGMVLISVSDTGIGIAAEQLEEIFEPFVQAKSKLHVAGIGVGLGLAISRQLARAMHGEITVASTPGEGSTFTLALPSAP